MSQIAYWTALAGEEEDMWFGQGNKPSFTISIAPLPVMPNSGGAFYGSYDPGAYISRQAANPQACWTWLTFLSEQPTAFHGVPARRSVAAVPEWETNVGSQQAAVYRLTLERVQPSIGMRAMY